MQTQNPQGILGLMAQGRAPQQPQQQQQPQQPMPSPDKASPMAGLGSVEQRVAAYRGNPAPLQQRYAMSQDLLDLLALQKIKSEKDAAARQMQMMMAQQQAAQGQMPTVAQQREKEVMEMTKNELARQQAEQTPPPQQLMGGIAQAPGADTAAQPQAMASGGIVAFADGGDVPGSEGLPYEYDEAGGDYDTAPGTFDMFTPESEDFGFKGEIEIPLELQGTGKLGLAQVYDIKRGKYGRTREEILSAFGMAPSAPAAAPAAQEGGTSLFQRPEALFARKQQSQSMQQQMPPNMSRVAGVSVPAGLAGLKLPSSAPANATETELRKLALDQARIDPEERERAKREEIMKLSQLTPEQRAVYEENIAGLRQMYEQQIDPERQRRERLINFLANMRSASNAGALGAGARASIAYNAEQQAAVRRQFEELQKARQGLVGLDREAVQKGITAGTAAGESAARQKEGGIRDLTNIFSVDSRTRDNMIAQEVELIKARLQAQANEIAKVGIDNQKLQALAITAQSELTDGLSKIQSGFVKEYSFLLNLEQQQGDKMNPDQRKQLDIAYREKEKRENELRARLQPEIDAIRAKLGRAAYSPTGRPVEMTPGQSRALGMYGDQTK